MKVYLFFIIFIVFGAGHAPSEPQVIIDADTANEVDDLYAIVRAFAEPDWNITTLNATQWQSSQWAVDNTMEASHRLNSTLHTYLKLGDRVLLRRGGENRMYDWGDQARHSAAAYEIIKQAHAQEGNNKLKVIALGALTNVASALYIDPTIGPKLEVYWLGTTYNFETNQSKRLDFNAVMDVQAVEVMLTSQVEMHIMPINIVSSMQFDYERTKKEFQGKHELTDFLVQRWFDHSDGGWRKRLLWDVSLIEAIAHPQWAEEIKVSNFENKNVWMYKSIDNEAFVEDLYDSINKLVKQL